MASADMEAASADTEVDAEVDAEEDGEATAADVAEVSSRSPAEPTDRKNLSIINLVNFLFS